MLPWSCDFRTQTKNWFGFIEIGHEGLSRKKAQLGACRETPRPQSVNPNLLETVALLGNRGSSGISRAHLW